MRSWRARLASTGQRARELHRAALEEVQRPTGCEHGHAGRAVPGARAEISRRLTHVRHRHRPELSTRASLHWPAVVIINLRITDDGQCTTRAQRVRSFVSNDTGMPAHVIKSFPRAASQH